MGRRYFVTGALIVIFLSFGDIITTYAITPDLKNEGNIFILEYGFGWWQLIIVNILLICFILIPFYYHALVFNYPLSNKNGTLKFINAISIYFLANHKNVILSISMAMFNGLGVYFFWWYSIHKGLAIVHNSLCILNSSFSRVPFYKRMEVIEWISGVLLVCIMTTFLIRTAYAITFGLKRSSNTKRLNFLFIVLFFVLFFSFRIFILFGKPIHSIKLVDKIDTDIILINFEDKDRAFIGELISKIDSCNPSLIVVDAFFKKLKNKTQDSILSSAFKKISNDFIIYGIDSSGRTNNSAQEFTSNTTGQGLLFFEQVNGLVSKFTPIRKSDSAIHKELALKIVEQWRPNFEHHIKINESIPIQFRRMLPQFINITGSELSVNKHCDLLKNKIVLVGYLGPSFEDMYYTPVRIFKEIRHDKPDTYGLVIIANEIRTILEYEKAQ